MAKEMDRPAEEQEMKQRPDPAQAPEKREGFFARMRNRVSEAVQNVFGRRGSQDAQENENQAQESDASPQAAYVPSAEEERAQKTALIGQAVQAGMPQQLGDSLTENQEAFSVYDVRTFVDITKGLVGSDAQLSPLNQGKLEAVVVAAMPVDGEKQLSSSNLSSIRQMIRWDKQQQVPHEPLDLAQFTEIVDKAKELDRHDFYNLCYDVTNVMPENGTRDKFLSELGGMNAEQVKSTLEHEEKIWGDPFAQFRERVADAVRSAVDAVRNAFSRSDTQAQAAEAPAGNAPAAPASRPELSAEEKALAQIEAVPEGITDPADRASYAFLKEEGVPESTLDTLAEHYDAIGSAGVQAIETVVMTEGKDAFPDIAKAVNEAVRHKGREAAVLVDELGKNHPEALPARESGDLDSGNRTENIHEMGVQEMDEEEIEAI